MWRGLAWSSGRSLLRGVGSVVAREVGNRSSWTGYTCATPRTVVVRWERYARCSSASTTWSKIAG
jgi:hypothetical protein